MIDVEQRLREELDRFAPATSGPDWDGVLKLAGARRRRRAVAAVVLVAALGGILAATPLGAGIVHSLGGFSAWLTGQPGSPVSPEEQQAFDEANARSWLGFPAGTQLRRLADVTDPATGATVDLLGFRTKSTLCLRVTVTGKVHGGTLGCAPLDELRRAGAPVRVVLVDQGFGRGTKRAWYGLFRLDAPALQVTAGIAADSVRRVIVVDDSGRHTVRASSNAFLYVAMKPDVGRRVKQIWAETDTNRIRVPFAPAPVAMGGVSAPKRVPGPTNVERKVGGGTIRWLDRHEPRGQPLDVLPPRDRRLVVGHTVFGRIVAPDPARPLRVAITLSHSRHGHRPKGLCISVITRSEGSGGGCAVRADAFARSPFGPGIDMMRSSSSEFVTDVGLASDDVARIVAFLADGGTMPVSLADNAYVVDIARFRLPARLVAYDAEQRVIGFTSPIRGPETPGGGPARGRARLLLQGVSPTGAAARLYVGRSTSGGRCMYLRWDIDKPGGGLMESCSGPKWHGSALQLNTPSAPAELVGGRVRPDVAAVVFRFADGARATVRPTQGFVLYVVPRAHLLHGHELVTAAGRNSAGATIGTQPFLDAAVGRGRSVVPEGRRGALRRVPDSLLRVLVLKVCLPLPLPLVPQPRPPSPPSPEDAAKLHDQPSSSTGTSVSRSVRSPRTTVNVTRSPISSPTMRRWRSSIRSTGWPSTSTIMSSGRRPAWAAGEFSTTLTTSTHSRRPRLAAKRGGSGLGPPAIPR